MISISLPGYGSENRESWIEGPAEDWTRYERRWRFKSARSARSRAISSLVGQALAADPGERIYGSLRIVDLECYAVVVAEVELRKVTVKVVGRAVLIDASHTALEHAEKSFDGVRGGVAVAVLMGAVVHGHVLRELLGDLLAAELRTATAAWAARFPQE